MNSTTKRCALCEKATANLKKIDVCRSCDDELEHLFSAAAPATENNIPVTEDWDEEARVAAAPTTEFSIPATENWDEEARRNPAPSFFFPGKPSNRTTHRFLFGCRSCGSRDCNTHNNYLEQVEAYRHHSQINV